MNTNYIPHLNINFILRISLINITTEKQLQLNTFYDTKIYLACSGHSSSKLKHKPIATVPGS